MFGFSSSVSALRASQLAINTISNNIANANTPGYHRQRANFGNRPPVEQHGHLIGTGVNTLQIQQTISIAIETSINANISALSQTESSLGSFRQLESTFRSGPGSIFNQLERFFNNLQELTTEPSDPNRRLIILRELGALANEVTSLSEGLNTIETNARNDIAQDVDNVNQELEELFQLKREIQIARASGREPNDLVDRFLQRASELSGIIDLEVVEDSYGGYAFRFGDGRFRFEDSPVRIETIENGNGEIAFGIVGSNIEARFAGGRLAALQKLVNVDLPEINLNLATFTSEFVFQMDRAHTTGLGLNDGFSSLVGVRGVTDVTVPFADVSDFDQVQSGDIFISVTEEATGRRTIHQLTFDPNTQSLEDLVADVNAIANINAVIQSQTGAVAFSSPNGFRFDFAGRLENSPQWSDPQTTAQTRLSGNFAGPLNDELTFRINGTGAVGSTDGLELEVTGSNGQVVGTYNIGTDYEPGSAITLENGIVIEIGAGNVEDGSEFQSWAVTESDETGMLAALGINSLFSGSSPRDMRVNQDLLDNPDRFATSLNGESGDNGNIERLLELRSFEIGNQSHNFETFVEQISITVAQEVSTLSFEASSLRVFSQQLLGQRDSISGVDPNEETVDLLRFQRSYEASVRVISTIDEMLSELFSIIR